MHTTQRTKSARQISSLLTCFAIVAALQQYATLTLGHDCLTGLLMNRCQSQVYCACAKAGLYSQPDLKGGVLMAFLTTRDAGVI